ncbi:MAG: hypothetical protein LKM36_09875 [Flavobacteriales bacterium]|jgi:hypothetical protein|nr:hypothetical protein [Flavobacteriales bacterium]
MFDRTYYHYDQSVTIQVGMTERYFLPEMTAVLNAPGNGIAVGPSLWSGSLGMFITDFGGTLGLDPHRRINGFMNHCSKQWLSMWRCSMPVII